MNYDKFLIRERWTDPTGEQSRAEKSQICR